MRFFFRSRQFKIILSIFLCVVISATVFGLIGEHIAPQADIAGTLAAPFKSAATFVSGFFSDISKKYSDANKLMLENAELKNELNDLRKKVADYSDIKSQNEFYKNYLEIKDANPDFSFTSASLIARDAEDPYGGFTLNKGSLSGISKYDPVITDAGVIGYISEVGLTTSKVATVLSPEITLGALVVRTKDSGIVSGSIELAKDKLCRMNNLSRSCSVAVGDWIMTSGEGIFPEGLLIGQISAISSDKYNTSIYADIKPFAELSDIKNVMVITDFEGQGGINPDKNGEK